MARSKPWLKMWVEWMHDPKMLNLTLAEQGAWWRVVSLCQECDADGYLVKGNGAPMTLKDIANCIHLTKSVDFKTLSSMVEKMESQGSLSWNEGCLFITNFAERQAISASETKEAVRERVRRFRERQRVTETSLQEEIREVLLNLPSFSSYLSEHEAVKETIAQIGLRKGYRPQSEVNIPSGRVDLIWDNEKGEHIAAFEIDARLPKWKSITKLRELNCPRSFIILRAGQQPFQTEGNILLIGLGRPRRSDLKIDGQIFPSPPLDRDEEGEGEGESNGVTAVTDRAPLASEVTETPLRSSSDEPPSGEKTEKKDIKKAYGEAKNVHLTDDELAKLKEKFGPVGTEERITSLSLYKGSKGKKYASDYLTILNWERMHEKEAKGGRDVSGRPKQGDGADRGYPGADAIPGKKPVRYRE